MPEVGLFGLEVLRDFQGGAAESHGLGLSAPSGAEGYGDDEQDEILLHSRLLQIYKLRLGSNIPINFWERDRESKHIRRTPWQQGRAAAIVGQIG